MKRFIARIAHSSASTSGQRGQGLVEYGIILVLVAVALVAIVRVLEPAIEDLFEEIASDAPLAPPSLMGYTPPPTFTPAPTNTAGPSPTNTATATNTATPTNTPTALPPTATNTPTPTRTPIPSATNTPTNTRPPTNTPTNMPTNTPTNTPTRTPIPSNTPTRTPLPSNTPTNTPTNTPSPTPPPPSTGPWTFVRNLNGDARRINTWLGPGIEAQVEVWVRRTDGGNVSGATVRGSWGLWLTDSCTTGNNGRCTIERDLIWVSSATFTVTDIEHQTLSYNASENNVTSITVSP